MPLNWHKFGEMLPCVHRCAEFALPLLSLQEKI
jgi:hypothetical protein